MIWQKEVVLPPFTKGSHLITSTILSALPELPETGLLHLFVKHTSAGITINENADPTVREDFDQILDHIVPEDQRFYKHTMEGADDMPAHMKSTLTGNQITIPITKKRLNLGTWQGVYFCEYRNFGGNRRIVLTIYE